WFVSRVWVRAARARPGVGVWATEIDWPSPGIIWSFPGVIFSLSDAPAGEGVFLFFFFLRFMASSDGCLRGRPRPRFFGGSATSGTSVAGISACGLKFDWAPSVEGECVVGEWVVGDADAPMGWK